jgi:hypothetical protein
MQLGKDRMHDILVAHRKNQTSGHVRVALEIRCAIMTHIVTPMGSRVMKCNILHSCSNPE